MLPLESKNSVRGQSGGYRQHRRIDLYRNHLTVAEAADDVTRVRPEEEYFPLGVGAEIAIALSTNVAALVSESLRRAG